MKWRIGIVLALALAVSAHAQLIINEIDYDQPGTDDYEFVELAGPAGTYNNVVVDLINGYGGSSYKTITLGNITLTDETDGYGFYVIGVPDVDNVDYSSGLSSNWIQNGDPDGVQLMVDGSIVDGVAYDGALNDLDGNPMEDVDSFGDDMWEGGENQSIGRLGLDGSPWAVSTHTPGAINTDQVLSSDVNYPPTAEAGPNQLVLINETVTLDGSESSDPNEDIASYQWTQFSGVSVTLTDASAATTTFTAPGSDADLAFELTVTDSESESDKDSVYITVREPQDSKLIISEYIEGSSNNKAIELYNVDDAAAGLTGYAVKRASNGGGWSDELPLSGTLGAGEVYVIANNSASNAILDVADTTHSVTWYNGNDAIGLFLNDVLVDVIGDPNSDSYFDVAGISGAAAEHTLIRKPHIETGNTDWSSSAGTNADDSEWIVMDQDYFSDLGTHTAGPVAYTFSNATVTTPFPQSGSEISLSVDITPGEDVSAPSTVKVWYGTGGAQPNSADMWLERGNTYNGVIPSLSQGNVVLEYYFEAEDGSNTASSALYNVVVAGTPVQISDIHDNIETYKEQIKTIEGVMTIGAGVLRDDRTSAYIQDNSGRGLNVYDETLYPDLERGARVKIVGEVDLYYTTVEIKDITYHITATGESLPAAQQVSVAGANSDDLEGTLATVTGTLSRIADYSGSENLILSDGSDSTIVKVWGTTGIDTDVLSTGTEYAITGVGSKYSDEHQLLVGYQEDITDDVAVCDEAGIASGFGLSPAYPNPFNPVTSIEFTLEEAGSYELSVYNITGRRISTLSSGYAEPGIYKQAWNAGDVTSGIYFIRLRSAGRVATRKVVLIK
ncbi:MAG: lamin tail domain-containing protein [Fidelibacterota bacterium]